MAIVRLNVGNLTLEANVLKNRLAMGKRRRKCYKTNWIKRKISRRGINIMWKCEGRIGQRLNRKIKCSLRKCRMRMRSLRVE
jgi:hypothetical protein